MFLVVRTPRKTVGLVSDKIGGHKGTTGEAGIATTISVIRLIRITVEIEDSR